VLAAQLFIGRRAHPPSICNFPLLLTRNMRTSPLQLILKESHLVTVLLKSFLSYPCPRGRHLAHRILHTIRSPTLHTIRSPTLHTRRSPTLHTRRSPTLHTRSPLSSQDHGPIVKTTSFVEYSACETYLQSNAISTLPAVDTRLNSMCTGIFPNNCPRL
jgi:hypothetical protein